MRWIIHAILEWIGRAGRHVKTRLVLRLVTIAAFKGEDALAVNSASQTDGGVGATILAPQRRVTSRMTIDAARMHEDLVRFSESCACAGIVSFLRRTSGRNLRCD